MSFKKKGKTPLRNKSSKQNLKEAAVKATKTPAANFVDEVVSAFEAVKGSRGMLITYIAADGSASWKALSTDIGSLLTMKHIIAAHVDELTNANLFPKQAAPAVEEKKEE